MNHIWNSYAMWAIKFPARYKLLDQLRLSDLISDAAQDRVQTELAFMLEVIRKAHDEGRFGTHDIQFVSILIHAGLEAAINSAKARNLEGEELKKHIQTAAIIRKGVSIQSRL